MTMVTMMAMVTMMVSSKKQIKIKTFGHTEDFSYFCKR